MLKLLIALAAFASSEKPNHTAADLLAGKWIMHIYLRDKSGKPRLFEDEVTVDAGAKSGTLVVPKAFTAKLENIVTAGRHFSFEIRANEGSGEFRVRYTGDFHPADEKTFTGFGDVLAPEKELLGGFVGQKVD